MGHVDRSKESFSWDAPRLDSLTRYASANLRWTDDQIDSALNPLRTSTTVSSDSAQTTLPDYYLKFSDGRRSASVRSKRLRAAFGSLSSKAPGENVALGKATLPGANLERSATRPGGSHTKRRREN